MTHLDDDSEKAYYLSNAITHEIIINISVKKL